MWGARAQPPLSSPALLLAHPPSPPTPHAAQSIPGGVVVRYITGRGRHSADGQAKIKPRVVALLAERGVPYVEGPGWVEATLVPAVH